MIYMKTFDDMRDQYNSWPKEKQLNFFKYLRNLKKEHSILEKENNMLKEALRELSGVKCEQ